MVRRIYVEKREAYALEAHRLRAELQEALGLPSLGAVRILNRYDVEGVSEEQFARARETIFSEPQVDVTYDELPDPMGAAVFGVELLPGQYDQRADSCAQCIQLAGGGDRPTVRTARIYLIAGGLDAAAVEAVKRHLINPVESREAALDRYETLQVERPEPADVAVIEGFTALPDEALDDFIAQWGLAMDRADLQLCRRYFKEEHRDPTVTELRVIDTYWSDHCRHTTFRTRLTDITIDDPAARESYDLYLDLRRELYGEDTDRPVTLMDLATIGAKALKKAGKLPDLDESEEINACSVKIKAVIDGRERDYLLMFKNETHNHPTEIEPFGGAATCLGGAIRDPLSGRSYVYQAMRLTGAADPRTPSAETLPGKLAQRTITTTAAAGYSAYGNQIGLATGHVAEVYHPGYAAKRMEVGAVIGAAPAENVVRKTPEPGDLVILLGGRTGRDGCGGATGSSKSHTADSVARSGAEVQKGNAPEERKLQRLFRNPEASRLIKRCNDFGAGGVSVAIGELADGVSIDLDRVRKKYDGLDGTELAISESQERMAAVVAKEDADRLIALAAEENLEAYPVAEITALPRMVMRWRGREIVNLARDFIGSNGAPKTAGVHLPVQEMPPHGKGEGNLRARMIAMAEDLNVCSQRGLVERFDSTVGAGTVTLPFGGRYQMTPTQSMTALIPTLEGTSSTASIMAWGFDPYVAETSPYCGAVTAVVESVAKLLAAGGSRKRCWLSFQEYFERLREDPDRWGKPFAALLGALKAQMELELAAIGGKDSMSGSFESLDVPPTLISFAAGVADAGNICTPEFKGASHDVVLLKPRYEANGLPDFASLRETMDTVERLIADGHALSVWAVSHGGIAEGLFKMALGNRVGFYLVEEVERDELFIPCPGAFIVELRRPMAVGRLIGVTDPEYVVEYKDERLPLSALERRWEAPLESIFPTRMPPQEEPAHTFTFSRMVCLAAGTRVARPRVVIPAFPGTNCEIDTARKFKEAGAEPIVSVVRNLSPADIEESIERMASAIRGAQMIAIPGGFSGGDEPDGSAKFITAFFRNPRMKEAVMDLLRNRDGLMLGICNGFQALVKLGLLPYGEIRDEMTADSATLTFNTIGRHQSMLVRTRIASNKSPWLQYTNIDDIHTVAISHGEGRFVLPPALLTTLKENGQIATQYVDLSGRPTMDIRYNPNGSIHAIEGITSPDGRIFGKMGHSERYGSEQVFKNVPGEKDQKLFKAAVDYFRL